MVWVLILFITGSGKALATIDMDSKEACIKAIKTIHYVDFAWCVNRKTGEVINP